MRALLALTTGFPCVESRSGWIGSWTRRSLCLPDPELRSCLGPKLNGSLTANRVFTYFQHQLQPQASHTRLPLTLKRAILYSLSMFTYFQHHLQPQFSHT